MSSAIQTLFTLTDQMAAHLGLTHWAISMRIAKKGDFLDRLRNGGDCSTRTYESVMARLSAEWPDDLAWPTGTPRPLHHGRKSKAA